MEVSVTNQAYIFLSSIAAGLMIGFVFDIFRILRRIVKTSNFITFVEDIVFWILVALIIFTLVFVTNDGELRWYEFLGVILGVIFYNLLFSFYVIKVSVTVLNFIKKIIKFIITVLLYPFVLIYKMFRRPCGVMIGFIRKIFRKIKKIIRSNKDKLIKSLKNVKNLLKKT